ncbi:amidase [Chondromyces apiculatus]|uniref:amidase n=1 Tax=Chondromyces apiculatus TaxID=51 RepID=UPI001E4BBB69|nr:amidase [Chondromyces apiculatus]
MPRISGRALTAARVAAESPVTAGAVRAALKGGLGITALQRLPLGARAAPLPSDHRPLQARASRAPENEEFAPPAAGGPLRTAADIQQALREGRVSPVEVTERALAALEALRGRRPSMNVLAASDVDDVRAQAAASAARYAAGAARGALDGVPVLIKDELDVAGLPTRQGSRCTPEAPKERDGTVAARLRGAGAVILGKTVMTEWGMSPIGANVNLVMPRNPHHPERAAGGSSTGSAVGVALGVAPLAVGTDAGGSIRLPASLCGVFGIKPTYGRVSSKGSLIGGSVTHAGPIGASVADLAAFLDAVASTVDPEDPTTRWAPPPPRGGFSARLRAGVRGLRIGVIDAEWRDASSEVASVCWQALHALEREGAEIVRVLVPLSRSAPAIGYVTVVPEVLAERQEDWLERREVLTDDLRLTLAVGSGLTALEYLDGQRLRTRLREQVAAALREVDVLALPTMGGGAPRYTDADVREGFGDPAAIDALCRFAFLGNLTGLPAGTAPVGVDGEGVPVGLQFMGDAWDEAGVLGVMEYLSRAGIATPLRAPGAVDLLG